jgi:hypothetical protein
VGRESCRLQRRHGTLVAAAFYILVETARLHDVEAARHRIEAVRSSSRDEILLPRRPPR